jgi:ribosomal protein S18 acetylase RimI-like enzyme
MSSSFVIRQASMADWPQLWPILQTTFASGDTYPFLPDSPEDEILQAWMKAPRATYVAESADGTILGTYYIKPNQVGLGAHVCNCGYVVSPKARHRGVATALCEHSQQEAVRMGFRAMQFNLVVSTNERAFRLWQHLGFETVGRLPGAFNHLQLGEVDAYVLYKRLKPFA